MYTTRVPRPRALRPRHSVVSQWDVLLPLGIAPPDPEIDATEMPDDPAGGVGRRAAARRRGHWSRQSAIVVVHVSAGNPFRRWPAASFVELVCRLASKDPKRRIILTSGPSDAEAAAAIARDARARLAADERAGDRRMRRVRSRRAARAGRTRGALHRRRQRSAAYRGHDGRAGCGIVWTDVAGAIAAVSRRARSSSAAAEVPDLPCRPCNQRRCEPGDFRCLTGISAEAVADARRARACASRGWSAARQRIGAKGCA